MGEVIELYPALPFFVRKSGAKVIASGLRGFETARNTRKTVVADILYIYYQTLFSIY